MSKLDKKTLKWCARLIKRRAEELDKPMYKPTYYFDAEHPPSKHEREGRVLLLRALAEEIKWSGS